MHIKRTLDIFPLLALGFCVVLVLQLTHSVRIDAFTIPNTPFGIVGYLVCLIAGILLIFWGMHQNNIALASVFLILVFMIYGALVLVITKGDSPIAFLVSRYGVFMWAIIGAGTALVLQVIRRYLEHRNASLFRFGMIVAVFLIPVPLVLHSFTFLSGPVPTLHYQSVADSAIVVFCILMFLYEIIWPKDKPFYAMGIFTVQFTFVAGAIALMQSTSIVAFWGLALPIFYWRVIKRASSLRKIVIACGLVWAGVAFFNSELYQTIAVGTRLQALSAGTLEVSSVSSRLDILASFPAQFGVSPVFGDFMAEERSGFGVGKYVHSIPLSLLTHTGLIGFVIMTALLAALLQPRLQSRDQIEKTTTSLCLAVLVLGSCYAFFTWLPFWFFLGFMTVRPYLSTRKVEIE